MQHRIFAAAVIAMGIVSGIAAGQGRGSTGTPTTGGSAGAPTTGTGTTTRPGSLPSGSNTNPFSTSPFPTDAPRPILITGKVMLDDGTSAPSGVLIERVCASGRPKPEAYTDMKGHFTVTLGQEMGMLPDASETSNRDISGANPLGGVREDQIAGCDLRAMFAGYRSDTVSLAGKRYLGEAEVGTIVLHRLANVEGLTVSATSSLAPKDAKKAYEKGMEAVKKSKPDDAQKDFEKAVETYPKYATAWYELGRLYEQRDHLDLARNAYTQSVAADGKYVNPYERMYMLDAKAQKWQEVADLSEKVLHMNPYDFPSAYYFNGLANLQLKKLDPAEKSMREAVKLDTRHENPRSNYLLGIILSQKQDFAGAAECLRAYLKDDPSGKDSALVREQLAELEKVAQVKQN